MNEKIAAIIGVVSASIGTVGAAISQMGLCMCVLAPIFSILGITSLSMGILLNNSIYLILIGITILIISFIMHKKKCVCHVHKKR